MKSIVMCYRFIFALLFFLFVLCFSSCVKDTIEDGGESKNNDRVENDSEVVSGYVDTPKSSEETMDYTDDYFLDFGRKSYEISDAGEFRARLPLFHFTAEIYQKKQRNKFQFTVATGSLIYAVSEYLHAHKIYNEKLLYAIVDILQGDDYTENYAWVTIFLNDINYGRFLFSYFPEGNWILR